MDPQSNSSFSRRQLFTTTAKLLAFSAIPVFSEAAARRPSSVSRADPAVMDKLSAYMAAAGDQALPPEVIEKTKQHVLDTLAAMVSGTQLLPGQAALRFAGLYGGTGNTPVAGSSLTCSPLEAAVANGMLAHADETDDSHAPSHSHPGCATVPAALVAGDLFAISGTRFLRALALGYDIGTRVLMSMGGIEYQAKTHHDAHSMANTFAAAAAAGCAASLAEQPMRWLLDFAAQQDSGIAAWQRDQQHIEKAFVFGGGPARNGVTAALLIHAGATGIDDTFSGTDNFYLAFAPAANPALLIEGLGERFEITRASIKKWSVGSPIQAPLDALQSIRALHPFHPNRVRQIIVHLGTIEASTVNNREMPNISLQQMIAVMLVKGTVGFNESHDRTLISDPAIVRARNKVQLVPDAALQKLYPQLVSVVEVILDDGSHWSQRIDHVRGTVLNPMSTSEVAEKARDLLEPRLGTLRTTHLMEAILNLESLTDLRMLRPLLQPPA
ncbi:MmgE/PrpD family protein [Acidicapsa dinghuensis]|uniref:MmgE/PrpD family protein n=1 Tax=Acidicapsa dinghuensis TaxID=2218256 RepID=A0ABW1EH88_9BACT|nr:MmgE/PrpD family protein [Acidicapsa dinghuensis]